MTEPPEFDRFLFRGAAAATIEMDRVTIERRSLGFVDIPDGRVYACDPLVPMDSAPLTQTLSPGEYEVVLFIAVGNSRGTPTERRECNAAAALICSAETPDHWTLASRENGLPDEAAYGVDSGTGAFMGVRAMDLLLNADETIAQPIITALAVTPGAIVTIDATTTIAAFTSGIGDGIYDTWLGFDAQNQLVQILTDFSVLRTEAHVTDLRAKSAARRAKKWWLFWK